jgi:tetratricopeptide (TPR) repeat protein
MTGNLLFNIGATMADRFLFIPSIGASLLIVYFIFKILKTDVLKNFSPQRAAYILVPILLVFSVKTFTRNRDWKGNDTLFTKDVNTVPASARAHYNYGTALMYKKNKSVADEIAARKEYETCLRIDPTYTDARINLGASYAAEKLYDNAIAIYKQGLLYAPLNSTLYGNIGDAYFKNKQGDSAIVYLEKAQQLGNKIPDLFNLLGTALFQKQEYDRSITAFEKGIALDSTSWNMYLNYGSALAVSNKKEEALKAFQRSYGLNSSNAQTLYFIALAYRDMGDTLNANKYYDLFMRTQKP